MTPGIWAGRCAWIAAALKEADGRGDESWIGFALSAQALAGDRPLDTIPPAERIATATADNFDVRCPPGRGAVTGRASGR